VSAGSAAGGSRSAAELERLRSRVAAEDWWHAIELAPGLLTPGWWDLRPTAARVPWPGSLAGLRCLDVGTMDGFWAFELERRGASEVVAVDLVDPRRQDSPCGRSAAASAPTPAHELRGRRFELAARVLGSRATYLDRSVYDLDPEDVGEFDCVVVGYVLQMLRDPLRALEALRGVCRGGWLLVIETVSAPLSLLPAPLARLNARRGQLEWFVFNRAGLREAVTMAGFAVEEMTGILRDAAGPAAAASALAPSVRARHALGLLGRSVALRARAPR